MNDVISLEPVELISDIIIRPLNKLNIVDNSNLLDFDKNNTTTIESAIEIVLDIADYLNLEEYEEINKWLERIESLHYSDGIIGEVV